MSKYLLFLFLFACSETKSHSSYGLRVHQDYGFHIENKVVYYGDFAIPEADAPTFKILSPFYGKDAQSAFFGRQKIEGADAPSFEYLRFEYARDKSRAYDFGQELPGFDGSTFFVIDSGFIRDRNHVVFAQQTLPDADPETLIRATGSWDYDLFADKNAVYCYDTTQRIFSRLTLPNSLKMRPLFPNGQTDEANDFFTNGVEVFLNNCTLVAGADARNFFELSDASPYFGDRKTQVYFYTTSIPAADALSFKVFEENFAKDSQRAYYLGRPIPTADPATFEVVCRKFLPTSLLLTSPPNTCGGLVGRDRNRVFDPNNFTSWTEQ